MLQTVKCNELDLVSCKEMECTGCSIMIAPSSTAKTNKTLAKLFLYYNSLNKVTLLCKVSDCCVLLNLKKNTNY